MTDFLVLMHPLQPTHGMIYGISYFLQTFNIITHNRKPTHKSAPTNPIIAISNLCRKVRQPSDYGVAFRSTKRGKLGLVSI